VWDSMVSMRNPTRRRSPSPFAMITKTEASDRKCSYLTYLAKREGLLGFTAEVLIDNKPMLHVFEKGGFDIKKKNDAGVYDLKMAFRG